MTPPKVTRSELLPPSEPTPTVTAEDVVALSERFYDFFSDAPRAAPVTWSTFGACCSTSAPASTSPTS